MGCPTVVITHGLELSVKYHLGRGSVRLWWFRHEGAGPCFPTASGSRSGFYCLSNSHRVASRSRQLASTLHPVASLSSYITCRSLLNSMPRFGAWYLTTATTPISFLSSSWQAASWSWRCLSYLTAPESLVMLDPPSIPNPDTSCNVYRLLEQLLSNY
jgi:hypothetical protein